MATTKNNSRRVVSLPPQHGVVHVVVRDVSVWTTFQKTTAVPFESIMNLATDRQAWRGHRTVTAMSLFSETITHKLQF